MRRDVEIQVERLLEEARLNATRSDTEDKVHEVNGFFEGSEFPNEFSKAVHGVLEGKKALAISFWIRMVDPDAKDIVDVPAVVQ
jgi:hypothetical protein